LLIGLGVGVDYALFIVTRHRQGLVAGQPIEKSIVNAVNTSGRAVLFAGIIVCIALLGMFALGVSFLYGLAVAAAIGVLLTMISALTLLPAMLGFIGPKVMSPKQKRNLAENGPRVVGADSKGFWPGWADRIRARPTMFAMIGLAAIALLARPGFNGPLQLVTVIPSAADKGVITTVVNDVKTQPDVSSVAAPIYIPSKTQPNADVVLVNVYPTTSPQAAATTNLIYHLRDTTIPAAVGSSGVKILVGGSTAIFVDFAHVLSAKLPLFIALVVALSFILLSIVFRSVVIPLVGAGMRSEEH